jgi:carbon monoxide dehydrogenase subunit G
MRTVERRGEVAASPERIFAFLADIENLPHWQPGVIAARRLTDGPMRVGAVARVLTRVVGQRIEADLKVIELDEPRHLAFESEVSGVRVVASVDVEPIDADRSEVVVRLQVEASGFMRFAEPMIAATAETELGGAIDSLRIAIASAVD